MPIEVKELHIKVSVTDQEAGASGGSGDGDEGADAIVEACVEKVLQILKDQKDR